MANARDAAPYLAEAQTVASLDHPHIVPVYDVGSTAAHPCFVVSKYVEGASLDRAMQARRWTTSEIVDLVATVADALHYAHRSGRRSGLVHRDIKPANILLDRSGVAYVADFGLALCEDQWGNRSLAYVQTG